MIIMRASSLRRFLRCPGSRGLPVIESPMSGAASAGTAVAKYLEDVNNLGDQHAALARVPVEHKQLCLAVRLERLPLADGKFAAEASFEYELGSGRARMTGTGTTGQYDRKPGCVYGTADIVAMRDGGRGYVGDYKYGDDPHGVVPAAGDNEQLAFYALALARAYDLEDVEVEIIRIRPSGFVERDSAVLDTFALDAFGAKISAAAAAGVGSALSEGDWCHYCPSYRVCPAKTALLRAVAVSAVDGAPESFSLTEDNAAAVLERIKRIRVLVDRMEEQVDAFAKEHPIALPDGYVYGPTEEKRRSLDADITYAHLVTTYGQAVADASVAERMKITQESAARALVAAGKSDSLKAAKDGLIVELERAGGVKTAVITKMRRHK